MPNLKMDAETFAFANDVLLSIQQAKRGEFAAVHTPEQINTRHRGRPAGSVKASPKISTTIRLSPDVLQAFRAAGDGWQTRIDAALKDWLRTHSVV